MSVAVELPSRWVEVKLEAAVEIRDDLRKPINSEERAKRPGPFPYYGATGQVGWIDSFLMDGEYVLLGEDGAPFLDPTRPKAYLVSGKSWVNNHAHVLKGRAGVCRNPFLLYALNQTDYRGYANGTTRLKLTQAAMRRLPIKLPPVAEQDRIVEKIEELFSDLDAGVAALERVRAKLKRYRASVLNAAATGKLTEAWRKQNPPTETADKLLARILDERRKAWEAEQLRKFADAGKKPASNRKDKYTAPASPDLANAFQLPETWTWAASLQVCERIENGNTPPPDQMQTGHGDVPFIKVYNLTFTGKLDFTIKPTFVSRFTQQNLLKRSRVLPGDVLMNIVGPPLGKVSIVPDDHPEWNMNQAVVLFRPNSAIDNRYLATCLLAERVLKWITSQSKATAGQHNISVGMSREIPLPLPPQAEQADIVAEVERRLSVVDAVGIEVEHGLKRAARLRQAILKRAFEGKLVPQDPADEPASTLLRRLSATTSAAPVANRGRRSNNRSRSDISSVPYT